MKTEVDQTLIER